MKAKKFVDSVTIRLPEGDLIELRRISTSLALDQAEVCRRAVRIGLGELREVRLPGGGDHNEAIAAMKNPHPSTYKELGCK